MATKEKKREQAEKEEAKEGEEEGATGEEQGSGWQIATPPPSKQC
jgi:hypothetical protein